jgi:hypothetical protein
VLKAECFAHWLLYFSQQVSFRDLAQVYANAKTPLLGGVFGESSEAISEMMLRQSKLTLRELGRAASFVQADFFTFYFTGIAGHETGFAQFWLERIVVFNQSAGNT